MTRNDFLKAARPRIVTAHETPLTDRSFPSIDNLAFPDGSPPEFSDEDLALKFVESYGDELKFCAASGKWLQWDGARWRDDETRFAFSQSRGICRQEAERARSSNESARLARDIASAKKVACVESLARCDRRIAVRADQFDIDPDLLNTPDGSVDLTTGRVKPNDKADLCTKMTAVRPENGEPALWLEFLKRVTDGDDALTDYLQRVAGYSLTGHTREHVLFFLHGPGRNGKGVFTRAMSGVMADYHRDAPMETFTASQYTAHPTELAMLRGARLVSAQETEQGRRWNESRLKAITGGDRISARFMRQDHFTFQPQFKLLFAGNHKPALRSVDEAMRARIRMVPFHVVIPAEERDPDLDAKLRGEWPRILGWMLDGGLSWRERGLQPPEAVVAATDAYLGEEDLLAEWLDESCERKTCGEEPTGILYESYSKWMTAAGERPLTQKAFATALEGLGFSRRRTAKTRLWSGLELIRPALPDDAWGDR